MPGFTMPDHGDHGSAARRDLADRSRVARAAGTSACRSTADRHHEYGDRRFTEARHQAGFASGQADQPHRDDPGDAIGMAVKANQVSGARQRMAEPVRRSGSAAPARGSRRRCGPSRRHVCPVEKHGEQQAGVRPPRPSARIEQGRRTPRPGDVDRPRYARPRMACRPGAAAALSPASGGPDGQGPVFSGWRRAVPRP